MENKTRKHTQCIFGIIIPYILGNTYTSTQSIFSILSSNPVGVCENMIKGLSSMPESIMCVEQV